MDMIYEVIPRLDAFNLFASSTHMKSYKAFNRGPLSLDIFNFILFLILVLLIEECPPSLEALLIW